MSVAFESSNRSDTNRIQSPDFSHGMWIHNTSDSGRFTGNNTWTSKLPVVKEEEDYSSTSSSIGNNSDAVSGGGGDSDDNDGAEVQSKANGPFNGLNDLENALPIKKGISSFYAGKSKSYGSLADAVSTPNIQDIVKPEDAYSRKRKNMVAHHVSFGISKRIASHDRSNSSASVAGLSRPPLPPTDGKRSANDSLDSTMRSPWRSLSLSDLQHASSITRVSNKGNEVDRR